jgi:hypothetical protein
MNGLTDVVRRAPRGYSALIDLWLALVHARLGHAAEARTHRDRAAGWLDQYRAVAGTAMMRKSPPMAGFLIEFDLLRREVEGLLRD